MEFQIYNLADQVTRIGKPANGSVEPGELRSSGMIHDHGRISAAIDCRQVISVRPSKCRGLIGEQLTADIAESYQTSGIRGRDRDQPTVAFSQIDGKNGGMMRGQISDQCPLRRGRGHRPSEGIRIAVVEIQTCAPPQFEPPDSATQISRPPVTSAAGGSKIIGALISPGAELQFGT